MAVVCALTVKQPDLGTTVEIAVIVLGMMFIAGARWLHLGLIAASALPIHAIFGPSMFFVERALPRIFCMCVV